MIKYAQTQCHGLPIWSPPVPKSRAATVSHHKFLSRLSLQLNNSPDLRSRTSSSDDASALKENTALPTSCLPKVYVGVYYLVAMETVVT